LAEALIELQAQLDKMRAETDREQLKDLSPDDAFEHGYAACLMDLRSLTGPAPLSSAAVEEANADAR